MGMRTKTRDENKGDMGWAVGEAQNWVFVMRSILEFLEGKDNARLPG